MYISEGDAGTSQQLQPVNNQSPATHPLYRSTAGIVLAAGASSRMGQPKLLLPWRGKPLIWHAVNTALEAGLSPVIVVTGAFGEQIKSALCDLNVQWKENPDWQQGQSTSVRAGVLALPRETTAVIFLLGDQPHIPHELVHALVEAHAQTAAAVIAPLIAGRRANPVLFDRVVFPELLKLKGDAGARQILKQYPPQYLPWEDEKLLLDIDTAEDYQQLLDET